ncbi:Hsp70 family protein [Desulfosarcina ovata]|uniref:Chaperone protein DnaK n=1 Tax=Desulfosarcina ovata subsp. ovata TaxID=2752305 RepID=A0A5K8AJ72_9BACT|nr:Hsp70 family protein [Desulfosarcina ovata]BBO92711.1 hypothetical protein DSCOOX_58910 [Desulfosarcina ovata subsp. ovata]
MARSIGIDLGTTNSVMGIKTTHLEIITNKDGEMLTPSCVSAKKKSKLLKFGSKTQFVVGRDALDWMKQDAANTITAVKRLMGRNLGDPEIQKIIADRKCPYRIAGHSRGTSNSLAVVLGGNEYTPEQISSKILGKLKSDAEKKLGADVDFAVITVPAYFNDKQKHATRTAAALAGLKVRRLLPEPTAAAISFGVDTMGKDDATTVLVFDFGGGTFDLSVLTISGGQFIEQGKGGNMWLGGEDIDSAIMAFVLDETAREYGVDDINALIAGQDEGNKNLFLGELKVAVEKAKIRLSDDDSAYIELPALLKDDDGDRIDIDVELTRERFDEMIAPIIDSTLTLTRRLLEDIHFTADLIDKVLLVGGSSRIPAVVAAMETEFGKQKVMLHERPMLAIAEGAAILSHRLSDTYECPQCGKTVSQADEVCNGCGFDLQTYMISEGVFDIVHAAAHDYYIHLENNERYLLIEKNTPLPCEKTETFTLVHEDQKLVHMKFFNIVNDKQESIGDLWLGVEEKKNNEKEPYQIEITLKIDENNLVEVAAEVTELPHIQLSKTLSRGKADEKLFLSMEKLIDATNQNGHDTYTINDLTRRMLSTIRKIDLVIDPETGEVNIPAYESAEMQIDKAARLAETDTTPTSLIYYAEGALSSFGPLIEEKDKAKIQKRIKHLTAMDEKGTYEETLAAHDALDSALDKLGWINTLMTIEKAGECCELHEPAKASLFFNALSGIARSYREAKIDRVSSKLEEILPIAHEVLDQYDSQTGTVYKDIRR